MEKNLNINATGIIDPAGIKAVGVLTEKSGNDFTRRKTLSEKAELASLVYVRCYIYHRDKDSFYDGYIQGAKDALKSQWRSVKDELPEDDTLVLVEMKDDESELCHTTAYRLNGVWAIPDEYYYDCEILAWMPIPEH